MARVPMPDGMNGVASAADAAPGSAWLTAAHAVSGMPTTMIATWKKSAATTPHMPLITFETKMTAPMASTAWVNSMPNPERTLPAAISCAAKMPSRLGMFESDAHSRTPRRSP